MQLLSKVLLKCIFIESAFITKINFRTFILPSKETNLTPLSSYLVTPHNNPALDNHNLHSVSIKQLYVGQNLKCFLVWNSSVLSLKLYDEYLKWSTSLQKKNGKGQHDIF